MFKFLKRPPSPSTPMDEVRQNLQALGYELSEAGVASARLKLDAGIKPVAVAAQLAVVSMAHSLKHAGIAATGVLRFRPQAADLLEKITKLKETGRLDTATWQNLHDDIIGISSVNDQQEAWLDKVLQDPSALTEPPAIHK